MVIKYVKGSLEINAWMSAVAVNRCMWDVYGLPGYGKGPATLSYEGMIEMKLFKGGK